MILQYRGFNNVWCYEEADIVSWANVWVGKETRDYRAGGVRHEFHLQDTEGLSKEETASKDLKYVSEMHKAVDKLIQEETHFYSDEISYHVDKPFDQLENVCVVMMNTKGKSSYTKVFENKDVYLLNNHGQTVQRIS